MRRESFPTIALLVSLWTLLASCASKPTVSETGPPPDVRLGAVLELLSLETGQDHVETLLDAVGNAHVIIAANDSEEVHHVVVSPDGVVRRERIAEHSSPAVISAAFGSDGRLHVLLDGSHLASESSGWRAADPTPWDAAGIAVHNPRFVHGTSGLLWAFDVNGKEVGAKGRWEWYAFGGAMGAIVFPWHSASRKLVIVPEAAIAAPLWYVLDPQDNLDTYNAMPAVDGHGKLHVVYTALRGGLGTTYEPRYARTSLLPVAAADQSPATGSTATRILVPVSGSSIPWPQGEPGGLLQAASAVDAESGAVLVVRAHGDSYALEDGKWLPPVRLPLSDFWAPKMASAGGDAFHLLTTADDRVLYLLYADGRWSMPVELGKASVQSHGMWDALDIAGAGSNRAFAVWPTSTGIAGRWIDARLDRKAPAGGDTADQRSGAMPIPAQLLDFAAGNAELETPGIATGFSAATRAGSSGQLTKYLHDSAQWEALATHVMKDGYGDDLRWYFLGRAAEGLGLCDAAERYYRTSRDRSSSVWTRCLGIACLGFELPKIPDERMAAVEAMRAAGQCAGTPQCLHARPRIRRPL
jgi:hypothetical protein